MLKPNSEPKSAIGGIYFIFAVSLALFVSGCGGGESDLFGLDSNPQINQCIDISYQQTQQQVSSSSTTSLTTIWLRAKNKCDTSVYFQFCVDNTNPGTLLAVSNSVNYLAICQGAAANVFSGPSAAGGNSAVINQGRYADFILYSISSLESASNAALISEFARSKIYGFSATTKYYCSAAFRDGKGYVLNDQCTKA